MILASIIFAITLPDHRHKLANSMSSMPGKVGSLTTDAGFKLLHKPLTSITARDSIYIAFWYVLLPSNLRPGLATLSMAWFTSSIYLHRMASLLFGDWFVLSLPQIPTCASEQVITWPLHWSKRHSALWRNLHRHQSLMQIPRNSSIAIENRLQKAPLSV